MQTFYQGFGQQLWLYHDVLPVSCCFCDLLRAFQNRPPVRADYFDLKTNLNKSNEFSQRQWGTFLSVLYCDCTWQRHKLKRKQWRRGRKKCQRKANWTTAKERGGMVADNGDAQLSKHEWRKREKKISCGEERVIPETVADWEKKKTKTC